MAIKTVDSREIDSDDVYYEIPNTVLQISDEELDALRHGQMERAKEEYESHK